MLNIFKQGILPNQNPLYLKLASNNLKDFREVDRTFSLEGDLLAKVDRTSMLCSLECRAPFLNKKLWSFVNSIPDHYHIKNIKKKYLLKEAFREKFPKHFFESKKQGFGVPIGDWLRVGLDDELGYYASEEFIERQGYFNPKNIKKLVDDHMKSKTDNTFRVWTYYCFQKWYTNTML